MHIIRNTLDRNDTNKVISVEPLILTAISTTEFDSRVVSTIYPDDEIYYNIDNAAWGTLEAAGSKGKIYRRIDHVKQINLPNDWRDGEVIRLYELDTNPINGGGLQYCIQTTTVSAGSVYGANSWNRETFVSTGNYEDNFIFADLSLVENVVIGNFCNTVFKAEAQRIHFDKIESGPFMKDFTHSFGGIIGYNFFALEALHGLEGISLLQSSYFAIPTDRWAFKLKGDLVDTFCMTMDAADFGLNRPLLGSIDGNLRGNLKFKSLSTTSVVDIIVSGNGFPSTSIFIESNRENEAIIRNINFFSLGLGFPFSITSQPNGKIKYIEGLFSNLEYTTAATADIAANSANYSALCGKYILTASGNAITVIGRILGSTTQLGNLRVPIVLYPPSTEKIQIINNDVDFGILTNSQTYEADGANGETITLNWVKDRFQVVSGRTL